MLILECAFSDTILNHQFLDIFCILRMKITDVWHLSVPIIAYFWNMEENIAFEIHDYDSQLKEETLSIFNDNR